MLAGLLRQIGFFWLFFHSCCFLKTNCFIFASIKHKLLNMIPCPNCAVELIPGAKFCHRCGDKVVERSKNCPKCEQSNPVASVFCHHCGFHFEGRKGRKLGAYKVRFIISFDRTDTTEQLRGLFFRSLRQRVQEEFPHLRYSDFVERFYQSKFREICQDRLTELASAVRRQWDARGQQALGDIDALLDEAYDQLLTYFVIQFCPDLTSLALPEAILKYDRPGTPTPQLRDMIADYLSLDHEPIRSCVDLKMLHAVQMTYASKSFLRTDPDEQIIVLCDLSAKGNLKDAFALTDRGLYWKTPLDKPRHAPYSGITALEKKSDHLTINGWFFSTTPSLDLKMYKLLKKLSGMTGKQPLPL